MLERSWENISPQQYRLPIYWRPAFSGTKWNARGPYRGRTEWLNPKRVDNNGHKNRPRLAHAEGDPEDHSGIRRVGLKEGKKHTNRRQPSLVWSDTQRGYTLLHCIGNAP